MATLANFKQSTVIQHSKTQDFFKEFNNNRADKAYWDECKKASKPISDSAMSKLKELCLGKKDNE